YSEGEEIDGETSKLFSPGQSGYYTVMVADSNDCVSEMSEPYYFDINSVYDFVTSAEIINIYPNPSNGQFRVIVNKDYYSEVTLKLRNIIGSILYENEYRNISGSFDKTLAMNHLSAGVYILQIQIGNDVYNSKIIKY
ncbi:T9SS type A sorting domain-containing protein, partial [Bacteroidota bacterium]